MANTSDITKTRKTLNGSDVSCNFCGKNTDEVNMLWAGVNAFICDGCVDILISLKNGENEQELQTEI